MTTWTSGYVTDIDYTYGYFREMAPGLLNLALTLRGIRPPALDGDFSYCDLGCGQGFGANLLAAANPSARFHAIDFNPSHIAGAAGLAAAAGTANIRFTEQSFEEFLAEDGPRFDVVALHGVWSWVSDENRRTLVEILARRLNPGGVAYVSYNTLPGWAPMVPLRHLLLEHAASLEAPTAVRVAKALDFAGQVRDLKAGYFQVNPVAAQRLDQMKTHAPNYLAHEYFNRDWAPLHHIDVARALARAKLTFAAPAHLLDQLDHVNLMPEAQKLLAEIPAPDLRETVRDFFVNQQFRRDIFVRGAPRLSAPELEERLLATRFVMTAPRANVPAKLAVPRGELTLNPEIYEPLLDRLVAGPCSLAALRSEAKLAKHPPTLLVEALIFLVSMGHVMPARAEAGLEERKAATDRLNAAILDHVRFGDTFQALASPVVGAGVPVSPLDQAFLLARRRGADPVRFTWELLSARQAVLMKDGKPLTAAEDNLKELAALEDRFATRLLPVLQQLRIA